MRCILLIVALTAIASVLVHFRRGEVRVRHETRRLQFQQVTLQRELRNQQIQLSHLTSPGRVRRRAQAMALGLTERTYLANHGRLGGALAQGP